MYWCSGLILNSGAVVATAAVIYLFIYFASLMFAFERCGIKYIIISAVYKLFYTHTYVQQYIVLYRQHQNLKTSKGTREEKKNAV